MSTPTLSSATVQADGRTLRTVWSTAATTPAGGPTLSNGRTGVYSAGTGTTTIDYTLSASVRKGESVTVSFLTGAVSSVDTDTPNDPVSGTSVTNNSGIEGVGGARARAAERSNRMAR